MKVFSVWFLHVLCHMVDSASTFWPGYGIVYGSGPPNEVNVGLELLIASAIIFVVICDFEVG
jgi:hypothetical protein